MQPRAVPTAYYWPLYYGCTCRENATSSCTYCLLLATYYYSYSPAARMQSRAWRAGPSAAGPGRGSAPVRSAATREAGGAAAPGRGGVRETWGDVGRCEDIEEMLGDARRCWE
eukprot:scaffold98247_cov49-Phaeocystis_antarctica.AAC.1